LASEKKSADAFEAALRREIHSASPSHAGDCPAPEILAAYYDRSLSRSERAGVDSHLMSCARCQSMMASIARADDADRLSVQPESARGLFWITRLLAPVAMVGVVIAIAIGVRTRERPAPEVIALGSRAVSANAQPEQRAAASAPALEAYSQSAPKAANAPAAAGAFEARKEVTRKRLLAEKLPPPERALSNSLVASGTGVPAQPAARTQPEAAPAMRAEGGGPGSVFSGATASMATAAPAIQIYSTDGSVAWQIGASGTIMRSMNSGPWLAQRSGATTDLLAGSAPSNDVCWVVGKSGTILRTLNRGARWRGARAPTALDLTAVNATDSNNATVTAANGQRFTTHDGGVTWSLP
jgi:hypothetical protein